MKRYLFIGLLMVVSSVFAKEEVVKAQATKEEVKVYKGEVLKTEGLVANLKIKAHEDPKIDTISVDMKGDAKLLKGVKIEERPAARGQKAVLLIKQDATMVKHKDKPLDISIKMPEYLTLDLGGTKKGKWDIDGTYKDVVLNLHGRIEAKLDDIEDTLKIGLKGRPEVEVLSFKGQRADIKIEGDGKVSFDEAHIEDLNTFIAGSGKMDVEGEVDDLELTIQGCGKFELHEALKKVAINIQGSGDIEIEKGELEFFELTTMGYSNVEFGGTTKVASLSIAGAGKVKLDTVTEKLEQKQGPRKNMAEVEVKNSPKKS